MEHPSALVAATRPSGNATAVLAADPHRQLEDGRREAHLTAKPAAPLTDRNDHATKFAHLGAVTVRFSTENST
jgi:hypothetical protein